MPARSFERFGGLMAILAGLAGLIYLFSFLMLQNPAALVPAIALLVVGLCASAALVALYQRVKAVEHGFALWGLLLGLGGAGGAAIHSAFDLNNNLHPPTAPVDFASPIDPRGFLTFGVAGLAIIVLSALIVRGRVLARGVGYLGLVSGVLLLALYLVYLIILNPTNALVVALVLAAGIVQPVWYLWLGIALWRSSPAARVRYVGPERRTGTMASEYRGPERRRGEGRPAQTG